MTIGMVRGTATVRETRTVDILLEDSPVSWTPAGRTPIGCHRAEIKYDLDGARLSEVTVWGYLIEQRDVDRRARSLKSYGHERATGVVVRRYSVNWDDRTASVPEWLASLIEDYRP